VILCAIVSIPPAQLVVSRYVLEETIVLLLILWTAIFAVLISSLGVLVLEECLRFGLRRLKTTLLRIHFFSGGSSSVLEKGDRSPTPAPVKT